MSKLIIGLKFSPATLLSATAIGVTKVLVTYGGGMGGSHKTYYCTDFQLKKSNGMYVAKLTNGEVIEINPRYVVEIKTRTLVKVITDKTAHANYHNPTVKTSLLVEYIELEHNETFEATNENRNTSKFDDKRIVISYEENVPK
jgi:hypothetical protein